MERKKIEQIHMSLVNGQRKQMVEQIDEYGVYDFFSDYSDYLDTLYSDVDGMYFYFKDAVVTYNRIKNR